ncbi:MAG: Re/Si-specific NAD(P)(+) transhydrogenase subunit alpha [Candidatus Moranbacteria bacterium]|nr:Re/Si-specific NAD(P)(+) transhydrogenase subunit alpha [Candidatus Moranbacteria bacterium]
MQDQEKKPENKNKLKLLVLKEQNQEENRVALNPKTAQELKRKGFEIMIEQGAGEKSFFQDKAYEKLGMEVIKRAEVAASQADVVIAINGPADYKIEVLKNIKQNSYWISSFTPNKHLEVIKKLNLRQIGVFCLNLIPRITRAQNMDVLSSQSNLAGYKAVIHGAYYLKKAFPLMMTAAGTINPAKVVVLGAGVAGLQAIATAKRLGAQVEASDVRASTKEQVESLGAKFIQVPIEESMEDEKGYAKEADEDFLKKQALEVAKRIKQADVVITTALVPGKKAPILITQEMVKSMQPGSVIVDMAAVMGGNCELTQPDQVNQKHQVTIVGDTNLPSGVAQHASKVYAKNIQAFLEEIAPKGELKIDLENEIIKQTLLADKGEILHSELKGLLSN